MSSQPPPPREGGSADRAAELARQKLQLEIRELRRKWIWKPGNLSAVFTGILAVAGVAGAFATWWTGYFSVERSLLQIQTAQFKNEKNRLQSDNARLQQEKAQFSQDTHNSQRVSRETGPTCSRPKDN